MTGAWTALLLALPTARAAEPTAYALLVGSNRPGAGQQPLQHAVTDAERMRAVLTELGDYPAGHVTVLADPDAQALRDALDALEARLEKHAARDEDTTVLFYYSGHARASGLNLGTEEVPLRELRARLEALPATVRLVVLDACQSGALAQAKGATPAADFSYSSLETLQAEGTVVMASSSAEELSQESALLQGGFFTHHLVAGLRGAADQDLDGRVDLREAYGYAYRATLQSTTATAVGGQHATLQLDLSGQGEMILTRPVQASARLALPPALAGELLVSHAASGAIALELHKAPGEAMQLALPAGSYAVLLRSPGERGAWGCPLNLPEDTVTPWDDRGCRRIAPDAVAARGDGTATLSRDRLEQLHLELGVGYGFAAPSPYTERLHDFSYDGAVSPTSWTLSASIGVRGPLSLVVSGGMLELADFRREFNTSGAEADAVRDTFGWRTYRLGVSPRASLALLDGWVLPYAQAGAGLALARSTLHIDSEPEFTELAWGPLVSAAAGIQVMPGRRHRVGAFLQGEYAYAPTLDNLLGDTHISGGPVLSVGLRAGR